jgi:C4-dicarboxylate-specific signal transduction histidine kinase
MNRLSMMGELAASLTHEITQAIASAQECRALNFLERRPANLGDVMEALAASWAMRTEPDASSAHP